jgi:hypothetical protein
MNDRPIRLRGPKRFRALASESCSFPFGGQPPGLLPVLDRLFKSFDAQPSTVLLCGFENAHAPPLAVRSAAIAVIESLNELD